MDSFETVIFEVRDSVAWVTLNRPRVLNAYNIRMRDDLYEALTAVSWDSEIRAVVISGAGDRALLRGGRPDGVRDCAIAEDCTTGKMGAGRVGLAYGFAHPDDCGDARVRFWVGPGDCAVLRYQNRDAGMQSSGCRRRR